ncbi:MAG: IPT/TIG domain-containing protein, partial [Thermoleophilia bacterium]|nr:IPT/TIG domain-containing protein [Thermoleophilia bacterium]
MLALIMAAAGSVPALAAPEGSPDLPAGLAEADWIDIRGQIEAQQTADLSTTRSSPSLGSLGAIGTQEAYLKACNTDKDDWFGYSVAVSEDTVVVGAYGEDSAATGIDGDYSDNSASGAGAVYVFIRSGGVWTQQAYLKASNTDASDRFGCSVAISGDTLVVGAFREDSAATGVGGDQSDNSAGDAGAAYVFVRSGSVWTQQAYLKASNTAGGDYFGYSVGLCDNTAVIGAYREDSAATGVDGEQSDNSATYAGAAYVFVRSGETWTQQAYLKASNTDANDWFGRSVAISGDTVMVGSSRESSAATGIDGDHSDNSATYAGAAYVFVRSGETWTQQAYLKASNTDANDEFGYSVAVSGDTALVGAVYEASSATGVNGDQSDNSAPVAGAAYVFTRTDTTWTQQAYLKASNAEAGDSFGWSVGICENTVLVSAYHEASSATGVNGDQSDNSASNAGAAYVFTRTDTVWTQLAYLKASNTGASDEFGFVVAISGNTVLAGARYEDSSATGVDGDQSDNSAGQSGAVYVLDYSGSTGIQQAYAKASNTDVEDYFGWSVAASLAPTGDTVVVGAPWEDSSATGVNGDESDNSAVDSGAAYVFVRSGGVWTQQAYLKASNTGLGYDQFGTSVAISGDTVVVGAPWEDSSATGVDGDESDDSASGAGAAYVFVRAGETWTQQAYLKASNTDEYDNFGYSVAISLDTVVVGAYGEDSATTGVDGDQSDNTAASSGAAYVFTESDGVWTQQAYLKASNTDAGDNFGYSVAISLDQLVVGAYGEASCATGVDGDQSDNTAAESGAAYIFYRPHDGSWFQEAYLKASNTEAEDYFGYSVAVSGDTVVVGAYGEDSSSTGVNGNQTDNSASGAGAAYVFALSAPAWVQQAYIKASNIEAADRFGYSVAVSGDTVLVGAYGEDSNSTGVNGDQTDNSFASSGAAYVLTRTGDVWTQQAYLKASNPSPGDDFGHSVAIAGETVVMGAREEDSSATGVNGDQADNGARNAGAAYILVFPDTPTITGLSPATGPTVGGTEVTISGTEFVGVTGVSFGSTPATSYTVDTDTQITASSPARDPGVVQVRVSAAGGSSQDTAADDFTYVAVPTVSGLDPASGPVAGGTSVTITGT